MLFHIVGARHASPGAAPAQETGCRFAVPAIVGEGHAPPGDALTVCTSHRQNGKRFRLVIARRPTADVAISGRHLQLVQGSDKT